MPNIIRKDTMNWEIFFEELPDWVIPMIKVIPQFYVDDIYNIDDIIIFHDFNYFWEKVNNINYRLYIHLSGYAQDLESLPVPLYVDINCYIINSNFRNSEQHQLGY